METAYSKEMDQLRQRTCTGVLAILCNEDTSEGQNGRWKKAEGGRSISSVSYILVRNCCALETKLRTLNLMRLEKGSQYKRRNVGAAWQACD